ncbi:MAG: YXWGXW repeat-containing protein [Acidobacteria bacterium]|nr:YXWGXW repeat-containing protein [Acidobacteriota bacterium]
MRSLLNFRTLLLAGFVGLVSFAPSPAKAQIAVGVSIRIAPPAIPVYEQPPCPVAGYMWTPGYWAYGPAGYYWVPGVWIAPPRVGLLWTPGYWGWGGGVYAWHAGYWGPHVGFYGGVNYGFGYGGVGFGGGEWRGGVFAYNTAVVHVNETVVHNTYINNTVVVNNTTVNRTSFNGGPGGLTAHANAQEMAASRESHVQATSMQTSHEHAASLNHANFASENHGRPATPAMSRVNAREANQQARSGQGVRSGQLTPGETSHLENKEAGINREVRNDRAANGGHLTQQERTQVNHQQNAVSRDINRDKHNARTDHPVQERNERPHR